MTDSGWWYGPNTAVNCAFTCNPIAIKDLTPNMVLTGALGTVMVKSVVKKEYEGPLYKIGQTLLVTPDTVLKVFDKSSMGTTINGIEISAKDFNQIHSGIQTEEYSGYVYNIVLIDIQRERLDYEGLMFVKTGDTGLRCYVPTLGIKYKSDKYCTSVCHGNGTLMQTLATSINGNAELPITIN
jgi:hypothetical protein